MSQQLRPGMIFEDARSRHLEGLDLRGVDVLGIMRCSTCGAPHALVIRDGGDEVIVDL
jgi:hypothetical protein